MNPLLLLPLAFPFLCLAAVSLLGFLGVLAIGGALQVVASIKSGLVIADLPVTSWRAVPRPSATPSARLLTVGQSASLALEHRA
jgi:hypothetical protein